MTPDPELGFVREILLGFKTSGTFVMPPGRRAQVVEAVSAAIVEVDAKERHAAAVEAAIVDLAINRIALLTLPGADLPERQIVENGVAGLEDAVLAEIAVCVPTIEGLSRFLDDQEVGAWYYDVIDAQARARRGR